VTTLSYIVIAVCLSGVAFLSAMIGIGGGILYTPVQVLVGIGVHEAAATSLALIMMLSFGATIVYHRAKKVDFKIAFVFETFTVVGGFFGGYFSGYVAEDGIISILITALLVAAAGMFLRKGGSVARFETDGPWYVWKRSAFGSHYHINMFVAAIVCIIAGGISGMTGVGGGFIKVPMMVIFFAIPIDTAIATSGFMVGITAIAGFIGHLMHGHWNPVMTFIFAPGVLLGSMLGAKTMLRIEKEKLRRIFAVFMIVLAAWLAWRFFG